MYKLTVFFVLLSLVFYLCEAGTFGRSYGDSSSGGGISRSSSSYIRRRTGYSATGRNENGPIANQNPAQQQNLNETPSLDDHGLSLWALILLMIAVIVAGFTIYYGVICYPFLCKNEKTYQFMEVSSTMTEATSRSIQSIENFQTDHKH